MTLRSFGRSIPAASAVLLLAAGASAAMVKYVVWQADSHSWTAISGNAYNTPKELVATNEERALEAIAIGEEADHPCFMEAHFVPLPGSKLGTNDKEAKAETLYASCKPRQVKGALVGAGNFVTALQVCTNDKKESTESRIKGLRLWGASVGSDGKLRQNLTPGEYELPNCADWKTKVSCPEGTIATGLRGSDNGTGGIGSYQGIALRCSKLTAGEKFQSGK
jgi:hypothetical protein